mgnify:CR=1 FL=1
MDWYMTNNPDRLEDKIKQYATELPRPLGFYNSVQYRPTCYRGEENE